MLWKGQDRRRFPRSNFPCLIRIQQQGKGAEPILTHTEDMSVGGVGVSIPLELELFEPVMIELDLIDGDVPICCFGKVLWVVPARKDDGSEKVFFDTGLEFVNMPDANRARLAVVVNHNQSGEKIAEDRKISDGQG